VISRQHAPRDTIQVLIVTSDQGAERGGIALPGTFKQLTVAGSGHL
jgi:hypothetical protein